MDKITKLKRLLQLLLMQQRFVKKNIHQEYQEERQGGLVDIIMRTTNEGVYGELGQH